MNFAFATTDALKTKADLLILPLFDAEFSTKKTQLPLLGTADKRMKNLLISLAQQEGFAGKADQVAVVQTHNKLPVTRVMLVGLGARTKFTAEILRQAMGKAVKAALRLKAKTAVIAVPELRELESGIRAIVEGFELGAYRYTTWKTGDADKKAAKFDRLFLALPGGRKKDKALDAAITLGRRVSKATNFARDLVNEPAGTMTPTILAEQATKMAEAAGLTIEVLGREQIEELKMGMFLGVARGSVEEPKLIHVTYTPANEEFAARPAVALIGKAITFDSGGLSLKPSDGMLDMKTDMAGSAAVLGAMEVIAYLKPPFPVHGFMGACENMPSGNAYRLGDVLVSHLGKTVEITNTDAEGRLVLGDILAYANKIKPALMIDLATLTGACIVALGNSIAGAFGDDDQLAWNVLDSARSAGEEVWRMPLSETVRDVLKSDIADMKNAGERWGGAISAALFLKEFTGDTPWMHLDIAGPSTSNKEKGYFAKGATGFGVRTLVELIRKRAAELETIETAEDSDVTA